MDLSNENSNGLTEFQLSDLLKTSPSLIICDLRKKEDFAKGHIKKSVLVEFDEKKLLDFPQNSKIILVSYDETQPKKMARGLGFIPAPTILRSRNIDAYYLIGGIRNYTRGLYCTNISYIGTGYP